ncbi:MAG: peptidase S41, partial [Sphingobacteriales bacterium]
GMINYFFPYKDIIGENWNNVLADALPGFVNAANEQDYVIAAMKIIARVKDTHANIYGANKVLNAYRGNYLAPFEAKFIEEKLVVTDFYTDTLGIKDKIKPGDVIAAINGSPVEALMKKFLPLTAASNYPTQLRDLPFKHLLRTNEKSITIDVLQNGKKVTHSFPSIDRSREKNFAFEKASNFKLINKEIGYIYPAKYKNTDLPEIQKQFAETKGIIVDMRCYPSDFMPFTFGNYIKKPGTPFAKFTQGNINYPGVITHGPVAANGGGGAYQGKVVVIVNEDSQSQAEYTTMAFQSAPNVVVIGSTTAGADGNVSGIILPGNIATMISGIGVFYPDNTPTQRVGVKIDHVIKPTIKGIAEGRDELMEKAIALIKE